MGNAISLTSMLSTAFASQATGTEVAIATLKKTNDVAKQEGAALVQMIEDSLPQVNAHLLDTYA
jgi:hypothetical protein